MILKKGDFFTVVKWISHHDNSYKGDVLEVKVIDENLVRAIKHTGFMAKKTLTLDLNMIEIKLLSDEFVNDALPDRLEAAFKAKDWRKIGKVIS